MLNLFYTRIHTHLNTLPSNIYTHYMHTYIHAYNSMTPKKVYPFLKRYNFPTSEDIRNMLVLELNCISVSTSINENTWALHNI